MAKTLKTPKTPKTLKTPKIERVKRVKAVKSPKTPEEKKIKRAVSRVRAEAPKPADLKEQSEIRRVLVDVHTKPGGRYEPERYEDVQKEPGESRVENALRDMGNWSHNDSLWHYGSMLFNQETYQQSSDRVRLYYEAKYSYPSKEYLESMGLDMGFFEGWMSGFMIGAAYMADNITPEKIKQWEIERAERLRGKSFDDDIPF